MKTIRVAMALATGGFLASCGGGGGGGGSATGTAVIDSANAQAIASAVASANLALVDAVGATGGEITPQGATGGAVSLYRQRPQVLAATTARSVIRGATREAAVVGPLVAFGPTTEPCLVSGTVRLSGNIANPPDLSVGDTVNATLTACDDGDGYVMDGGLNLRVERITGNVATGNYRIAATTTFNSFEITAGTDVTTLDGGATLVFDNIDPAMAVTQLTTRSLRFTVGSELFQLSDYFLGVDVDLLSSEFSIDIDGFMRDSSAFDGTVAVSSPVSLDGIVGDPPFAGLVRITGANASAVEIEALNDVQARLLVDANGDGIAEDVQNVNWSELIAP